MKGGREVHRRDLQPSDTVGREGGMEGRWRFRIWVEDGTSSSRPARLINSPHRHATRTADGEGRGREESENKGREEEGKGKE